MTPQTVSELYPSKWLSHDDLNGRSYTLEIATVKFDEFYNPITKDKELKAFLVFANAKKCLILNVTQCHSLTDIFKSERFSDWDGSITASPGKAPNGKPTIIITAPAAAPPTTEPEPEPETPPELSDMAAELSDMAAANAELFD